MAVRKKKAAKKPVKRRTKKTARKTAAKAAKRPAKKTVKKKAKRREFGEGNYKASKRFRTAQEKFVKARKADIPGLGKAAEAALEGPEGASLRAAETEAAGHAAGES